MAAKKTNATTCETCGAELRDGRCPIEGLKRMPPVETMDHLTVYGGKASVLDALLVIRRVANFERAGFTPPECRFRGALAESDSFTQVVRDETKLYRETWLNPVIDSLIRRERFKRHRAKARAAK